MLLVQSVMEVYFEDVFYSSLRIYPDLLILLLIFQQQKRKKENFRWIRDLSKVLSLRFCLKAAG